MLPKILQQAEEIGPDEMRQHEAVMQHRAPAHRLALHRRFGAARDDRPDQQLLGQVHARMRRHFKAAEFHQTQPPGRAIGGIELVDADFGTVGVAGHIGQHVAQQPVHQPGRRQRPAAHRITDLRQRDFQLVQGIVACLVDPGACEVGPMNRPENR